jgi:hypothetical protein
VAQVVDQAHVEDARIREDDVQAPAVPHRAAGWPSWRRGWRRTWA